jgi:hypothetical protein
MVVVIVPLEDRRDGREAVPSDLHPDVGFSSQVMEPAGCPIRATERADHQVVLAVTGVGQRRSATLPGAPAGRTKEQAGDTEKTMPDSPVGDLVDRLMEMKKPEGNERGETLERLPFRTARRRSSPSHRTMVSAGRARDRREQRAVPRGASGTDANGARLAS